MKTRACCFLISLFAGLVVLTPASAQSPMNHTAPKAANASAASETPATSAYIRGMEKMHRKMAQPYTNDADVDFAQKMRAHHEGAIAMAKVQLEHGKDPELRKLSEEIIAAQQKEILFLDNWLAQRHQ